MSSRPTDSGALNGGEVPRPIRRDPARDIPAPAPNDHFAEVHAMLIGGVARLPTSIHWHALPSLGNPRQERWNRLQLSLLVAEAWPTVELSAGFGRPPPALGAIDQLLLGGVVIRLATLLDLELEVVVSETVGTPSGDRLFHRINDVSARIDNAEKLHELRDLRNELAHDTRPRLLTWPDVWQQWHEVEHALVAVSPLVPAPVLTYKVEVVRLDTTAERVEGSRQVWADQEVRLKFLENDSPYCDIVWPYEYFVIKPAAD